ncbi:MAG: GAF domain-containing protein [Chloroflexi bacterium]|nr:GAF domain-containing protein [Chloroflexota bacterium]
MEDVAQTTGLRGALEELQRERAELVAQLTRAQGGLTALTQVASLLGLAEAPETLAQRALTVACEACRAEAGSIMVVDEQGDSLAFYAATGPRAEALRGQRVSLGSGIAGWVAQIGEPLIVHDAKLDARFFGGVDVDTATGYRTRSILCVPLRAQGKVIGAAELLNKELPLRFDHEDTRLFQAIADCLAALIASTTAL